MPNTVDVDGNKTLDSTVYSHKTPDLNGYLGRLAGLLLGRAYIFGDALSDAREQKSQSNSGRSNGTTTTVHHGFKGGG